MKNKFRTNTGLRQDDDALIKGSSTFERIGNTSEFQSGVQSGDTRLPSSEAADPQVVYRAMKKVVGPTKINTAYVLKFTTELGAGETEIASYLIRNPSGIFSIRYDGDDKLGYRIVEQKYGDIRYMRRSEMESYAKMDTLNSGWLQSTKGFYGIPGYGLKFTKLALDGSVDPTQAYMSFTGAITPDEFEAAYDLPADVSNTVSVKQSNSAIKLESQAVASSSAIDPKNLARSPKGLVDPAFGALPTFDSALPALAPEEITDLQLYETEFVNGRSVKYLEDATTTDYSVQPNQQSSTWKRAHFGGRLYFYNTASASELPMAGIPGANPEESTYGFHAYNKQMKFATLTHSARKADLGTPIGNYWKHATQNVSRPTIKNSIMKGDNTFVDGIGIYKAQIDKPFMNKGVEFYSSTQLQDQAEVKAGSGYGWLYNIDTDSGRNLGHMFTGEFMPGGAQYSNWTNLKTIPGWYAQGVMRFRRNSNPINNAGYDGAVCEFSAHHPDDATQAPLVIGLYTYDELPEPAFARVGFKIAIRKGNAELWSLKFNSPANSGKPGIVDYMMDTLTPDTDIVTGQSGYMPKFYSVGFGFKKSGVLPQLVRPFIFIDNVYIEGTSDLDLKGLYDNAGFNLSPMDNVNSPYFQKMGVLCKSTGVISDRVGGPTTDIYSFHTGFAWPGKEFSQWNAPEPGQGSATAVVTVQPVLEQLIAEYDAYCNQKGFGKPIETWDNALKSIVAGPGYQAVTKRLGLMAFGFCEMFFAATPILKKSNQTTYVTQWKTATQAYVDDTVSRQDWIAKYYGPMYYGITLGETLPTKYMKLVITPERLSLKKLNGVNKHVMSYDKTGYNGGFGFRFEDGVTLKGGLTISTQAGTKKATIDLPAPGGAYIPGQTELVNFAWLDSKIDKAQNGASFEVLASDTMWRPSVADDFVGMPYVFDSGDNFKTLEIPFSKHKKDKVQFVQLWKKLADRYVAIIPNSITVKNPTSAQPIVLITMSTAIDVKVQI